MNSLKVSVYNDFCRIKDYTGEKEHENGTTTIKAETSYDAKNLKLYIQRKGYGSASSKSAFIDMSNEDVAELVSFLHKHISIAIKAEKMRDILGEI